MAASRVRLIAEYRNGDGNFLRKEFDPKQWVKCSFEGDVAALEAAFLILLQRHKESLEMLKKIQEEHRRASHD